jgi:hypothetical protein
MSIVMDNQLHPIGNVKQALSSINALGTNECNHLVYTLTKVGDLQL